MKIREIIQTLFPTRTWKLAAIIAGGVLCGLPRPYRGKRIGGK